MKLKKATKCAVCGTVTKNVYGRNYDNCRRCFNKYGGIHIIGTQQQIFEEPLSKSIATSISLTENQRNDLIKRLDYIFPNRNKKKKFSKLSTYLRILVLSDTRKV